MSNAQHGHLWTTRCLWAEMANCPFCKAKASEFHISVTYATDQRGHVTCFMGECDECGAMGPTDDTERGALLKWNAWNKA